MWKILKRAKGCRVLLRFLFLACLISSSLVSKLEGATIEGVAFPDTHTAGDTVLPIRGLGLLRYMVFIKLYVAALYLEDDVQSEEVLSDVPKRLEIRYFHGIKAEDFARSTDIFITKNVEPGMLPQLRDRMDLLNTWYEDVEPGDRYALTYVPGTGTALSLNGELKGVIQGSDFAAAVFSIWLGKNPVDRSLQNQLLDNR